MRHVVPWLGRAGAVWQDMTLLRPFLGLFLSLVLAATSLTATQMRGHAAGGRLVEICSDSIDGSSVTTVMLDAQGNPVAPPHPCPDCTLAAGLAVLPEPSATLPPHTGAARIAPFVATTHRATLATPPAQARAPPVMI